MMNKCFLTFAFLLIVLSFPHAGAYAQTNINAYAKVTGINYSTNVITLSTSSGHWSYEGERTFKVGEKLIIWQVQDDVIGGNTGNNANFGDLGDIKNAGKFEVSEILGMTTSQDKITTITVAAIQNIYNINDNSSIQVVSVKMYNGDYTTTSDIAPIPWNGDIGGVVALYVSGTLTLNHNITASGLGFRGGAPSEDDGGMQCCASNRQNQYRDDDTGAGFKGEGIYKNTNPEYDNQRAKLLTGGGGAGRHNAGGGGGSNYTAGGNGGHGWGSNSTCDTEGIPVGERGVIDADGYCSYSGGGQGGIDISTFISKDRLFLGGGGGGGQQNDNNAVRGGNGGGAIFIEATVIRTVAPSRRSEGSVIISANAVNAPPTLGNDGGAGGGAGGTIVINVQKFEIDMDFGINISANGSNGSSVNHEHSHGGGGAGGQGMIVVYGTDDTEGVTLQTLNGSPGCNNNLGGDPCSQPFGGNASGADNDGIIMFKPIGLPVEVLFFRAERMSKEVVHLDWQTAMEKDAHYFTVYKSQDNVNWEEMSRIEARGNSNQVNSYETYDYAPESGSNVYKLTQTDFDGTTKEVGKASVYLPFDESSFSISPNPTTSGIQIEFSDDVRGAEIEILNTLGQVISSAKVTSYSHNLPLPEFQGIYFVRITVKGKTVTSKVVKQ